ncbi:MAG: hypothetical protein R3D02_03830 [Hyphomicrobiales bacterium]
MALSAGAYAASQHLDMNVSAGGEGAAASSKDAATEVIRLAAADKKAEAKKEAGTPAAAPSYDRARWDPIHFKPAIDTATNEQCLACHEEVLSDKVLPKSQAGVEASQSLAWYQTLDTYAGDQMTFHQRHLTSDYAKQVMDLKCTFCHQGNDPREESPHVTVAAADATSNNGQSPFTLRKMVNPSETCLRCHGAYPYEIMGTAPWPEFRADLETPEEPNGCLSCHAELFRTVRHQVDYLKADAIEEAAKSGSDVCYGCHGGRQWYRISYPYPRHAWEGMDTEVPDWAKDRPTESDPRYQLKK